MEKDQFEYLANQIFNSALEVHKHLGPGLLESVYVSALLIELKMRNIKNSLNVRVPLYYKGHNTNKEFFIDLLIENEIILEIKACEGGIHPIHIAQTLSYLKLSEKRLGFVINF